MIPARVQDFSDLDLFFVHFQCKSVCFVIRRMCLFSCRSRLLSALVVKRLELDEAMNWLSTLGGAYSALGDYFVHHVCITVLPQLLLSLHDIVL